MFDARTLFYLSSAVGLASAIVGGNLADEPPFFQPPTRSPSTSTTTTTTTTRPAIKTNDTSQVLIFRSRKGAAVNGLSNDDGTYSFLGLRYAEPPVRRYRFQRPRKTKLRGQIDATKYGSPCPQWSPYEKGVVIGSEDCLFLNIFTPEMPKRGRRIRHPVLVWIHGGNFKMGSGAQYYPRDIVRKGVIVVTLNYRLGSLGFLSLGRKELPGNVGLFDITTAVRWIREYISFFGGDPHRILPAGQGSGASAATMLALNNFHRSSLSGILAMSGSPVSPFSLDENESRTAREVSDENSCKTEEGVSFVRCMQELPLENILKGDAGVEDKRKAQQEFPKGLANLLGAGPTEEGKDDSRFLPNFLVISPLEAMKRGIFPKIPLMTGVTKEETGGGIKTNFLEQLAKRLTSPLFLQQELFKESLNTNIGLFVNKTADTKLSSLFLNSNYLQFFSSLISSALSDIEKVVKHTCDAFFNLPAFITTQLWSKRNRVFVYSFEHVSKRSRVGQFLRGLPIVSSVLDRSDKKEAEHGDDLIYLFDPRGLEGETLDNTTLIDDDKKVREEFTTMVAEFARSGTPKTVNGAKWSPYNEKSGDYMIIKSLPTMAKNFKKCEMALWTGDSGLLGSPDCSVLNQASEIALSTIGSAQSSFYNSVDTIESTLGVDKLKDTVQKIVPTVIPTSSIKKDGLTGALGGLGVGKGGGSGSSGSGGSGERGEQTGGGSDTRTGLLGLDKLVSTVEGGKTTKRPSSSGSGSTGERGGQTGSGSDTRTGLLGLDKLVSPVEGGKTTKRPSVLGGLLG